MKTPHLLIAWPGVVYLSQIIYSCLKAADGEITQVYYICPNSKVFENFIDELYDNSPYEKLRVEEKKSNLLKNASKGIEAIIFVIEDGCREWSGERLRYVYPRILDLKQTMRNRLKEESGIVTGYDTIHMTDDQEEFDHDMRALMRLKSYWE